MPSEVSPEDNHSSAHAVLLVGPLPPPTNGLSVAFSVLLDGLLRRHWRIRHVDIADRTGSRRGGTFSLRRMSDILAATVKAWLAIPQYPLLYITIAQSRMGFVRDLAICAPACLLGRPLVLHLHGGNYRAFYESQSWPLRALASWLLRSATRIIVLAEPLRSEFSMISNWQEKTVVIANPCTTPIRTPRLRPHGSLRLLYLSNLLVEKGYRDVLRALPIIAAQLPGWSIEAHLAGAFQIGRDGFADVEAMRADFSGLVADLPPTVSAQWHGVVGGDAKHRLLSDCDLFVLPTYYVNEGQPIAIIEALANGLPIITTAHRAIPEMLPPSMLPFMVPPCEPAQIARQAVSIAGNGALYEQLSRDAIARSRHFDPELHLEHMATLLTAPVLTGPGPQARPAP